MKKSNKAFKYYILPLLAALSGCSDSHDQQQSPPASSDTASPAPIDPSQIKISPNFEFRMSMGTDTWSGSIYRAITLTNKESNTFHVRYMVVNNRPECILYPIGKDGQISHFGALQNEDASDVYDGTVNFRTGDEIRIGRAITDINMDFLPRQICGRPSMIQIYMDEGIADFEIYMYGN